MKLAQVCRVSAMLLVMAGTALGAARAQQREVTIAHLDMLLPLRTVMESQELEKSTGYKINWRMFGSGADIIRAMASGDVQVAELGSSGMTVAMSQGQDIRLFWILDDSAESEGLIARNGSGINTAKDLAGKKVATPFASTSHYQLLAYLKASGVDAKSVSLVNMRPPEIAAAWERGDIDATYIWDPTLTKVKASGKFIVTSGAVGKMGYPTFDGLVVRADWASKNDAFLVSMVKAVAKADGDYRDNRERWTADSPMVKAVAKWTKADPKSVPASMALYLFPTLPEQASEVWLGGGAAKALARNAVFLKEQGRVPEVKPDYGPFVTTTYVNKAMSR